MKNSGQCYKGHNDDAEAPYKLIKLVSYLLAKVSTKSIRISCVWGTHTHLQS